MSFQSTNKQTIMHNNCSVLYTAGRSKKKPNKRTLNSVNSVLARRKRGTWQKKRVACIFRLTLFYSMAFSDVASVLFSVVYLCSPIFVYLHFFFCAVVTYCFYATNPFFFTTFFFISFDVQNYRQESKNMNEFYVYSKFFFPVCLMFQSIFESVERFSKIKMSI